MELGLTGKDVSGRTFYYGKGCENCNKTGYRGRSAIYEIMKITARIRQAIIERKSTDALRHEAQAGGMRTLRDSGLLKIFDGLTTIEEVVKQTLTFE
jgi:type IV pilus assembly protein PilB